MENVIAYSLLPGSYRNKSCAGATEGNTMMYCYEVIKENVVNGSRADRSETYCSNRPLVVGSLYMHLRDMKGAYRVLNELEVDYDD